ncbi:MAG: Mg-chelatase subunit ChlD [Verrucomicrobiales bacterium]|jgi:Mg-chelatase subunit ChlD
MKISDEEFARLLVASLDEEPAKDEREGLTRRLIENSDDLEAFVEAQHFEQAMRVATQRREEQILGLDAIHDHLGECVPEPKSQPARPELPTWILPAAAAALVAFVIGVAGSWFVFGRHGTKLITQMRDETPALAFDESIGDACWGWPQFEPPTFVPKSSGKSSSNVALGQGILPPAPQPPMPPNSNENVLVNRLEGVVLVPTPADVKTGGIAGVSGVLNDLDDMPAEVGAVLDKYVGEPVSLESLDGMVRDTIRAYRTSDRPVVDVLVPEQDLTNGVAQLVVVEGRLNSVRVQGTSREEESYLREQIRMKKDEELRSSELMADLPAFNRTANGADDETFQNARADASSGYVYESLGIEHSGRLPKDVTRRLRSQGQPQENLLASEQLGISGPSIERGYSDPTLQSHDSDVILTENTTVTTHDLSPDGDKVIEDLAWMNREPHRRVDQVHTPGFKFGTTDLALRTDEPDSNEFKWGGKADEEPSGTTKAGDVGRSDGFTGLAGSTSDLAIAPGEPRVTSVPRNDDNWEKGRDGDVMTPPDRNRYWAMVEPGDSDTDLAEKSADIAVTAGGNITFSGGSGVGTYTQLGHGGYAADGAHSGDVTVASSAGDGQILGTPVPAAEDAFAIIGHGGRSTRGTVNGNLTVRDADPVVVLGADGDAKSGDTFADIGNGGNEVSGVMQGNITVGKGAPLNNLAQDHAGLFNKDIEIEHSQSRFRRDWVTAGSSEKLETNGTALETEWQADSGAETFERPSDESGKNSGEIVAWAGSEEGLRGELQGQAGSGVSARVRIGNGDEIDVDSRDSAQIFGSVTAIGGDVVVIGGGYQGQDSATRVTKNIEQMDFDSDGVGALPEEAAAPLRAVVVLTDGMEPTQESGELQEATQLSSIILERETKELNRLYGAVDELQFPPAAADGDSRIKGSDVLAGTFGAYKNGSQDLEINIEGKNRTLDLATRRDLAGEPSEEIENSLPNLSLMVPEVAQRGITRRQELVAKADEAAEESYDEVLGDDPYNSSARRGMVALTEEKQNYYDTAYDHMRAHALTEVSKLWELQAPPYGLDGGILNPAEPSETESEGIQHISEKLAQITIPEIGFEDVALSEALEFLRTNPESPAKATLQPVQFPEILAANEPFSTFSLNVSDVSFKLAQSSLASGQMPDSARIRIEEFVNAFDYGDPAPSAQDKIACRHEQTAHPFHAGRNLMRIAMRTAEAGRSNQTPLRLTLLLDTSGSMERADRRETTQRALELLAQQLLPDDQVTVITFARQPRLLADRVSGQEAVTSLTSDLGKYETDGGTNLEAALRLAMRKAEEQKLEGAQNRIVLITDGAANLGDADPDRLAGLVESMRLNGLAFDAAGVGAEGFNDETLEALTRKGDGRYYFLDSPADADEGFANQIAGALRPAAMNVKVQVEFNPKRVGHYKLLGYEKHRLATEDFRNDAVDAAELAAAEAGVALYQFEPMPNGEGDVGFVSVRFRDMASGKMVERRWPIPYEPTTPSINRASASIKIATTAALLGAKLKNDPIGESADLPRLEQLIRELPQSKLDDPRVQQLLEMIEQTRRLAGK